VELFVDFVKPFLVNMRVDLRSCDVNVTEHFLNTPQVSPTCKQMSRKTVSQGMDCKVFGHTRAGSIFFYQPPYLYSAKRPARSG
jgi:hypothetical protein